MFFLHIFVAHLSRDGTASAAVILGLPSWSRGMHLYGPLKLRVERASNTCRDMPSEVAHISRVVPFSTNPASLLAALPHVPQCV